MDEVELAHGLSLLLTARLDECEAFFTRPRTSGPESKSVKARAAFGLSLVSVIKALMSFQEEDAELGLERLGQVQKIAAQSWTSLRTDHSLEQLDLELLGADAGIFQATLNFSQESSMGFLRGAMWLRKSYKTYQKAEVELKRRGLARALQPRKAREVHSTSTRATVVDEDVFFDAAACTEDVLGLSAEGQGEGFGVLVRAGGCVEDCVRGSTDLGLGLFSLVFSLIPPRFMAVISALGFSGTQYSRPEALGKLRSCVEGGTARAPVAALVLLIFHSAMLIFARGVSDDADSDEAMYVLGLCLRQYPESPLFRFFEGRLLRGQSRLQDACVAYRLAQLKANDVKAMFDLCEYERAWCFSLLGHHALAADLFSTLARQSPWSPCFYGYLAGAAHFSHAIHVIAMHKSKDGLRRTLESALALGANPLDEARRWVGVRALCRADARMEQHSAMFSAGLWFAAVPTAVRKRAGRVIPPEGFATARATQFSEACREFCGSATLPDGFKKSATWEQLELLAGVLCTPSLEVAYFWNGFFQISQARRLDILHELPGLQHLMAGNKARHEPLVRLMSAALLRECSQIPKALQELAHFDSASSAMPDAWTAQFAKFERGLCLWGCKDKAGALEQWSDVADSGHFFEPRLRFKVRSAMNMASGH
jgi:hypothetical protein